MKTLKRILINFPILRSIYKNLNNQFVRDEFVKKWLLNLPKQAILLDAGAGSQRYKNFCNHLRYFSQDFGEYKIDDKKALGTDGVGGKAGYNYGKIDYKSDIWKIPEKDGTFDAILCTEVFEHIPYPIQTLCEFSRLLKKGGKLILTTPSNCLRHMDPYFFYTGFTDRWFEFFLNKYDFNIIELQQSGDYYKWLAVEMARTSINNSICSKICLFPAFIYFLLKNRTKESVDTLCFGYHVFAEKI